MSSSTPNSSNAKAWIITGPTSGIGHRTALELAEYGTVVLVGRTRSKLDAVEQEINARGGRAVSVVCDLSDITSARRAAADITALDFPIAGLLNNAGISPTVPFTTPQGWDGTYATNHLGPFALTEALMPALPDGAHVVFVVSAVEDPTRGPAKIAGFRGARYISAQASARGEWRTPGGSKLPGGDAYATSKQGNLATVLAFARENTQAPLQRRRTRVQPRLQPRTRRERRGPPAVQVRPLAHRAAHQILEHPQKGRPRHHHHSDRGQHRNRRLLRRERPPHVRVRPDPRPCLSEPGRHRNPRPAGHGLTTPPRRSTEAWSRFKVWQRSRGWMSD